MPTPGSASPGFKLSSARQVARRRERRAARGHREVHPPCAPTSPHTPHPPASVARTSFTLDPQSEREPQSHLPANCLLSKPGRASTQQIKHQQICLGKTKARITHHSVLARARIRYTRHAIRSKGHRRQRFRSKGRERGSSLEAVGKWHPRAQLKEEPRAR